MTSGQARTQTVVLAAVAAAIPVGLILKRLLFPSKQRLPWPPGPKEHFLFGNLLDTPPDFENGESYDTKNLENAKEHGLIFSVNIPWLLGRIIFVADPVLANKVLAKKNFPKASMFYNPLEPLIGARSLVTLKGEEWTGMRKTFNPGFAPLFLQDMAATMAKKLERFLAKIDKDIESKTATNMLLEAQSFTADVIVQIAFGEDWGNSDEPHPARRLEDEICGLYSGLTRSIFRRIFDVRTHRRMKELGVELNEEMKTILERRLDANTTEENAKDILSLAIAHIAKEKTTLSEEDKAYIVDQLKTFYFAGHDTTATTIAWAMWELSQHPEALARLRSELQQHGIWANPNTPPTYDQLQKCDYLEGVIKETLRFYPPASGIARQCDDVNETHNGMQIGGAFVIVNTYIMHRHPDNWKRPEEFLPERFFDGSEGDINGKFLPFSKGKRDCIGKYFALLEAKISISALAMRFNLTCDDPTDYMEQVLTNLPKRGAKVVFSPRK